ncbi:hypothetical protein ACFSVM_22240 [Paenibacillus shunpengii]|uniref:Uncharacterized protein n=1 Tax=Paenibacillus shunpengii TaxID=2054424 RepID=A0ABW5SUN2_9BACL
MKDRAQRAMVRPWDGAKRSHSRSASYVKHVLDNQMGCLERMRSKHNNQL